MSTTRNCWRAVAAVAFTVSMGVSTMGSGVDREDAVQVISRDVYVLAGASLINPDIETPTGVTLYSVGGEDLDLTWGEWQRASATARAHCTAGGDRTDVRFRLSGLIPGGVYSIFYGTIGPDTENPSCPGVERTLPVASKDPDQQPDPASLVADENGEADFQGRVDGCLLDATQLFWSLIYHHDGMTYGTLPNRGEFHTQGAQCQSSFGLDAMRQLVILQKW